MRLLCFHILRSGGKMSAELASFEIRLRITSVKPVEKESREHCFLNQHHLARFVRFRES
jgi:hypothetical protein